MNVKIYTGMDTTGTVQYHANVCSGIISRKFLLLLIVLLPGGKDS